MSQGCTGSAPRTCVSRSRWVARAARSGVNLDQHRNLEHTVEAGEVSGARDVELDHRVEAVAVAAQPAARRLALARWEQGGAERVPVAEEVLVDGRQLDRGARREPVDDHVDLIGAQVVAARRGQGHGARRAFRNLARVGSGHPRGSQNPAQRGDRYEPRTHTNSCHFTPTPNRHRVLPTPTAGHGIAGGRSESALLRSYPTRDRAHWGNRHFWVAEAAPPTSRQRLQLTPIVVARPRGPATGSALCPSASARARAGRR